MLPRNHLSTIYSTFYRLLWLWVNSVLLFLEKETHCEEENFSNVWTYVGIDIDLNVGDIRHPASTSVTPILEEIYRTENLHSDIGRVPVSTLELIPISISKEISIYTCWIWTQDHWFPGKRITPQLLCWSMNNGMLDFGWKFIQISEINIGLCSLQSDIGSSEIKLSPISLITDIRLSAHLCVLIMIVFEPLLDVVLMVYRYG